MDKNILIAQLTAARAQIEATGAQLDAALSLLLNESQQCQHPPESRINMSTMGHMRWQCGICGYTHEEVI